MNQSDNGPASATAVRIIRNIADLRGQDLPHPVLVRLAWFCIGAVFVLASVRPGQSTTRSIDARSAETIDA